VQLVHIFLFLLQLSFLPAFSLANVTAFLLNPDDLVDYRYTTEERKEYEETLDSQMDSV